MTNLYDEPCETCGGIMEQRPTYPGSKTTRLVCTSCGLTSDLKPKEFEKISGDWVGQSSLGVRF